MVTVYEQRAGMFYPAAVPTDTPALPTVLVHNHVRRAQRQGTRGFRFWLQERSDRLVACECGWAPHLERHYRVRR